MGLKFFSSFPLNEKFSGFSGLSGLSGLVPNYGIFNLNMREPHSALSGSETRDESR